uniref:Uncharacterized protein n=1 Tax=Sphaerodactylus townsendi TaxID=933632 RepID=A0ACB8EMX0_9SAUR
MVTRESDAGGMSASGEDVPGSGREKPRGQGSGLEQGAQRAFSSGWQELLRSFMMYLQAVWNLLTAQQRKQLPKFEAGGDQSLKGGNEKPPAGRLFHSDASREKPGMKSSSEATSILSERGKRANRQREQKTSLETAWKSPGMSSIAVIQHQKFNGKICVLTHEKGRNAQMSVSTRPQENVDLERGVEDEKLCEKVYFPQGDTTVITQPVTTVCVNAEGEKFSVDADYQYAVGWSDMEKLQQHQFNVICSDFKDVFYFDTGGNLPIAVMPYTLKQSVARDMLQMLHHGVTRKKTSKWRDTIVFSPEKKVSDYG